MFSNNKKHIPLKDGVFDNIMSNSKFLRDAGFSKDIVNDINNKELNHMKNTLK
jgi:hypothetical protein